MRQHWGLTILVSRKDEKDGGLGSLHPSDNEDLGWPSRDREYL